MARTRKSILLAAVVGLLAALGLQVVAATPASAIPGLTNVTAASAVNSNTFRQAIANCPVGMRVIGGGARISGPNAEVSITYLAPMTTQTAYEARAYEDQDGFAGVWQLVVTAICAGTPPGYEIMTAASLMASPVAASVSTSCSAGKQVLGTGGAVHPGRGDVVLTGIVPSPAAPTSVTTLGAEVQGGFAGTWNVQSWAICAFPFAGSALVVTTSVIDSASPKTQVSACPAGRSVHGVGFQFGGAGLGEVFLNMAFPNPMAPVGTSVPVVASEDQTGVAGNWGIRTYAVCVP